MKKRIPAILLITIMLISLIPSTAFAATSGSCGDGATWKVKNGTLTISGKTGTYNFDDYYPPWYGIEGITKVVVDEGILCVGEYAFAEMTELKSVKLPQTLEYLEDNVFIGSYNLEKITVASGNPKYYSDSQGALYEANSYGGKYDNLLYAPGQHKGVFRIGKNVATIGENAFFDCWYVTGFEIEDGNDFFSTDAQGALYNKEMTSLILVGQAYQGKFVVPDSVSGLSWEAALSPFVYCSFLTEVVLSDKITQLGEGAFAGCWALRSVHIPNSVKKIDEYAFYECESLTDIYYDGTEYDWDRLKSEKRTGNEVLQSVNVHYMCEHLNATKTYEGSCWENEMWRCNDCGGSFIGKEAPGHTVVTIPGREPTCIDYGLTEGHSCSVCGIEIDFQRTIGLAPHQGEWVITKEATQTETGIKSFTCTVCGEVETMSYSLYKKGDVNKDDSVDAKDATQILRYSNGKASSIDSMDEGELIALADVNNDGTVDAKDATQILRHVNGKASMLDAA